MICLILCVLYVDLYILRKTVRIQTVIKDTYVKTVIVHLMTERERFLAGLTLQWNNGYFSLISKFLK